jgi:predicted CoA-binding protein
MDWHDNLLTTPAQIEALLNRTHRVAVLGIRPERFSWKPAFYVPEALQRMGLEIVPVSVHGDIGETILGAPVYQSLTAVPGEIDLVDVFRRGQDIPLHLDDILAKHPSAVWFQSGIRNDSVAETLAKAGIAVVQDRCLMVDYGRHQRMASN